VAAGTRRIQALTGRAALEHIENSLGVLADIFTKLHVDVHDLPGKIDELLSAHTAAERAHVDSDLNLARSRFNKALAGVTEVLGVPILAARIDIQDAALLRKMTDWYGHSYPGGVIVIGAQIESRVSLVVRVSKDLLDRGLHADHLVAALSKRVGGRGGGKPTLAQGGGKHPDRLDAALAEVKDMVSEALAEHK
jgi:alanyl-tRNA synthetase